MDRYFKRTDKNNARQVDETTDISGISQLSIVFRNVKDSEVVRFSGFYIVSSGRTAGDQFPLLVNECDKYDLGKILMMQTYD